MTELLIWIFIALAFIAFFAGIEIAFISASRLNIELKKNQNKLSGKILSFFAEKPSKFLGTCLIAANIFLVIYGLLFSDLLNEILWDNFPVSSNFLKLFTNTVISAFIVLMFGEFIPKAVFRANADRAIHFFAPLIKFFHTLFFPLAAGFVFIANNLAKFLFDIKVNETKKNYSIMDLARYFQTHSEGEEEKINLNATLFENTLGLSTLKIHQCFVPRTEIKAFEVNGTLEELKNKFLKTGLSRIIIYEKNIDHILGYVHHLSLFKNPKDVKSILLPIPVVPETMSAMELLKRLTKERRSIACVIDEYGVTSGIITMEDIIEEVFGDIKDEYDAEDLVEKKVSDNEFIFSGRMELDILSERYGLNFPPHKSETLSGFIIDNFGGIPHPRQRIVIDKYEFIIMSLSSTRIESVKMRVL